MTVATKEWYADGLQFECTCCGACCTGSTGYVAFTPDEGKQMAQAIGLSEQDFYNQYAHRMTPRKAGWSLNERKTEHGYDCVFLDRTSQPGKALCRVHNARPGQCRTWPFWPENISSPRAWQRTARHCEGINQGKRYTLQQIRIERDTTPL